MTNTHFDVIWWLVMINLINTTAVESAIIILNFLLHFKYHTLQTLIFDEIVLTLVIISTLTSFVLPICTRINVSTLEICLHLKNEIMHRKNVFNNIYLLNKKYLNKFIF